MKALFVSAIAAAGLLAGGSVLAQAPAGFDDPAAVPMTTTTTTEVDYGYAATGWNPGLLLALGGALGAGSLALKGVLRRS